MGAVAIWIGRSHEALEHRFFAERVAIALLGAKEFASRTA